MALRIEYDRGTLRLEGDLSRLVEPSIRFDPRTGFHRAPAHRHAALTAEACRAGLAVDDRLGRALLPAPPAPPPLPLRDYQAQALTALFAAGGRGVVCLPTGSGKSRLACAAIAHAARSAVVLVPTLTLLEQWRALLAQVFSANVGVVGDGTFELAPLTVVTFASAYQRLDAFGHRFGVLVVDEVHHFAHGLRTEALEMCTAPVRLGLTATPPEPRSDAAARLATLVGPVVFERGVGELGAHLAPLVVHRHMVDLDDDERAAYQRDVAPFLALRAELLRRQPWLDWAACLKQVSRMPHGREVLAAFRRASTVATLPRAKVALAARLLGEVAGERVLLFCATADDAYRLGQALLAPVVTAETPRLERAALLEAFARGELRGLVSARVLNEGVDVPEASVALVVGGSLGQREHVQRIGRVLRPREGKQAVVHELVTLDTLDEARDRARRRPRAAPFSPVCEPA